MTFVEKTELLFNGKKITRKVYRHVLGSNIVKIHGLWFKVVGNTVTNKILAYDKFRYVSGYPDTEKLAKLNFTYELY